MATRPSTAKRSAIKPIPEASPTAVKPVRPATTNKMTPRDEMWGYYERIVPLAQDAANMIEQANKLAGQGMAICKEEGNLSSDLIPIYRRLRDAVDVINAAVKELTGKVEFLGTKLIPDAFTAENIKSTTTQEGDRVTVSTMLYASLRADKKSAGYKWLRNNKYGDMIQETINSSSLSALARELAGNNKELPESIFTTHYKDSTSLTRAKAKGGPKPKSSSEG